MIYIQKAQEVSNGVSESDKAAQVEINGSKPKQNINPEDVLQHQGKLDHTIVDAQKAQAVSNGVSESDKAAQVETNGSKPRKTHSKDILQISSDNKEKDKLYHF